MHHKLIIIGSGPAGYTAGIYASRAQLEPVMFSGMDLGGQLTKTSIVENFPGFAKGVRGFELMNNMREQMLIFGAQLSYETISKVDFSVYPFKIWSGENEYTADSIIVSTGAKALTLGLDKEESFYGKGISTCAVCDAAFYKGKEVAVIGGGDSALEDALSLTKYASKVSLIVRKDVLKASKIMQQRVLENKKITIFWNTVVSKMVANKKVESLELENLVDKKKQTLKIDGLFYAIGHRPTSELFKGKLQLTEAGYILNGTNGLHHFDSEFLTMTSIPGVFAAGDVVDFHYRQAITAAASGCMAALDVERWLSKKETL